MDFPLISITSVTIYIPTPAMNPTPAPIKLPTPGATEPATAPAAAGSAVAEVMLPAAS